MIQSINDEIRKDIISKRHPALAAIYLDSLNDKEEIIKLLFSDHYKMIFFIAISSGNSFLINEIKKFNIKDILEILDDPIAFNNAFKSTKLFNSLSYITKIGLFELLEIYNQDKTVQEITKLHVFDKIAYTFKYDLESFSEYYKDYRKDHKIEESLGVSVYICKKLEELSKTNVKKYNILILEILKEYYKWTYFISNNFNNNLLEDEKAILKFLETQPLDFIIEYMSSNFEIMVSILDNYLFYAQNPEGISKKVVDDYFEDNAKEEMVKKLKYNENKNS